MTTIKHRRGTAEEWTASNPVLSEGELGFETDTGKHKIGDGLSTWSVLEYFIPESVLDSIYAPIGSGGGTGDVGSPTTDLIAAFEEALST